MSCTMPILRIPRPSRVSAYVASRLGGPIIEPSTVRDVVDRYGFTLQNPPRNLLLSRRSLNAVVRTAHGEKVVKRYRPQWKPATVEYGHSILRHLESIGFPAVRLERTPEGATWICIGEAVFAVFDFVPGTNYSLNYLLRPQRLRLTVIAGETLARLHQSLDGFTPTGEHHLGFPSATGPRRRDISWHAAKLDELISRSRTLDDAEARARTTALTACAGRVLDEIDRLDRVLSDACLPRLVIHGDYGIHNLIYRGAQAVPVDFESSRLDWRVNELVSALGKYRYRGGAYDFESMHTFAGAYGAVFPLSADERRLIVDAWRLYKLQSAVQYWNSYFETDGPIRKLESALDSIGQSDWVIEHRALIQGLADVASVRTR